MRPIKFRAWDKHTKNMIADVSTHRNEDGDVTPWEFMQFTGLLDKNGKEIYEGDLIRYFDGKSLWEIAWDQNCARWIGVKGRATSLNLFDQPKEYEVIGNIHENPENSK